jgi:hypothetical protein
MRRNTTPRCSACGAECPLDELVADIRREEGFRLYLCRSCAQMEIDCAEQEYA